MTRRRFDIAAACAATGHADDLRHAIPMSRDTPFRCPEPDTAGGTRRGAVRQRESAGRPPLGVSPGHHPPRVPRWGRAHLEARRRGHPRRHGDAGLPALGRPAGQGRRPAADPGRPRPVRRRSRVRDPDRLTERDARRAGVKDLATLQKFLAPRERKPSPAAAGAATRSIASGSAGPARTRGSPCARACPTTRACATSRPASAGSTPARPARGRARSSSGSATTLGSCPRSSRPCAASSCSR